MVKQKSINNSTKSFKLEVPLDASTIEDIQAGQTVKVVAQDQKGTLYSQVVELDAKGKSIATITFPEDPGSLQVMVGPANASDEEMSGLQTLSVNVSARQWIGKREFRIAPFHINTYYWYWWLRWCRTFTIRGRVLCPDGRPVPGAEVCAYDMDWWWWWTSKQQVGCDTTDETGFFEITFTWCCGWWPWWWWRHRVWQLNQSLVNRILPVIQRGSALSRFLKPQPKPSLMLFNELLPDDETFAELPAGDVDLSVLPGLRKRLLKQLPVVPEFEQLRIWPWYPWYPWWDCTPDIVFKVTQNCFEEGTVLIEEGIDNARWNISETLDVTLIANENACCIDPTPQPEGNCILLTHACDNPVSLIGGNIGAVPTPPGYLSPGVVSKYGDRPYAENVKIRGDFGTLANAHYYEFEWYDTAASAWKPMPAGSIAGFTRKFYGPHLPAGSTDSWDVPFSVIPLPGPGGEIHNVIQTRQHFEANNGAGTWEIIAPGSRWWTHNKDLLAVWRTNNFFDNGTYKLRVKSWEFVGGSLTNPEILTQCGTEQLDNSLILTIDNRTETSGPTDPNGHPCGPGTVHRCTAEPDTNFISVKLIRADGSEIDVQACGNEQISQADIIQIDFLAHDPEGHLSYYTLHATYGDGLDIPLIHTGYHIGGVLVGDLLDNEPTATLTTLTPVPGVQTGPNYGNANPARSALDQGAVSPKWYGGTFRFRAPARLVFPETCCYQLELRAHKRTIVNCHHSLWGHTNYSEFSFMIEV